MLRWPRIIRFICYLYITCLFVYLVSNSLTTNKSSETSYHNFRLSMRHTTVKSGRIKKDNETHPTVKVSSRSPRKSKFNSPTKQNKLATHLFAAVPPHNIPFILTPPPCPDVGSLVFFIAVTSSPRHFSRRDRIRRTWGSMKIWNDNVQGKVHFLLGSPRNAAIQKEIFAENAKHGDIIQQDFTDSYRNLTLKSVMFLEWVSKYCKKIRYIAKVDDDVMLDVFHLLDYFQDRVNKTPRALFCNVFGHGPVLRGTKGWGVSKLQYKNDFYPPYCGGSFVIYNADVVRELHRATYQVPFIPVEDAYVTGLLAEKIGQIRHIPFGRIAETLEKHHGAKLSRYSRSIFVPIASLPKQEIFLDSWRYILCKQAHLQLKNLSDYFKEKVKIYKDCLSHFSETTVFK